MSAISFDYQFSKGKSECPSFETFFISIVLMEVCKVQRGQVGWSLIAGDHKIRQTSCDYSRRTCFQKAADDADDKYG